jgi:hypothetical protein
VRIFEHSDNDGDGFEISSQSQQLEFYPRGGRYSVMNVEDVVRLHTALGKWLVKNDDRVETPVTSPNPGDDRLRSVTREEIARAFDRMAVAASRLNHSGRDYINDQALEMIRETADATADHLREN